MLTIKPMEQTNLRPSRTPGLCGKPEIFKAAMNFRLGRDNAAAESIQLAAAPMVTQPMNGQDINDSTPTIKANMTTNG